VSLCARRAVAPLALMALIFVLSDQSRLGADQPEWSRIIAHFLEYATLATLWYWALTPVLGPRAVPGAAAISLLYAASDEYHQGFVPGRESDPLDVAVDAAGIVAALAAIAVIRSRRGGPGI
jgi:VanZ family protein